MAPGIIQVCLCVVSTIGSRGFEEFDSARALLRKEASLLCGWRGIVEIAEAVEGMRDMEGRENKALMADAR
jgi:hypothetical protein